MNAPQTDDMGGVARTVFAGLAPSLQATGEHVTVDRNRLAKGLMATLPIVLVGSMAAMTINLGGAVEPANAKPAKPKGVTDSAAKVARVAVSVAPVAAEVAAPNTYRVAPGDTISDIAGRYGLSTASVLAMNGLSWSSLIFPGQQLKLSNGTEAVVEQPPVERADSGRYTIVAGDTISAIADRFGISTLSVLTANGLGWSSIIYPGQSLAIPGLVGSGDPEPVAAPVDDLPSAEPVVAVEPVTAVQPAPPAAPAEPAPAPDAPPAGSSYTIQSGDTLSGIAAKFGISTQQLLDANGIDSSTVIYSGHSLTIPGISIASYSSSSGSGSSGGSAAGLNDEMASNARVIIQVGRDLGVPDYGIVIALAAAMQESSLRNINWGDLDSVGLFQQRPSAGWGSVDQLTTPDYAARLFYGGPSNPNAGNTRGLLDISGWQSMSVTQAAQRVQISAYPDAYAKWETSARAWLAQLG